MWVVLALNGRSERLGSRVLSLVFRMCVLVACVAPVVLMAQPNSDAGSAERRIKAAFLYKFADYVEWPDAAFARPDTPITVAIEGDDQLADELARIVAGRMAAGRPIVVQRLTKDVSPVGVHILFAKDVRDGWPPLSGIQSEPTLVVTDSHGALAHGSTINFVVVDEHVRFEVSLGDAERRGLRLSARLLAVAQNIRTGKP